MVRILEMPAGIRVKLQIWKVLGSKILKYMVVEAVEDYHCS